MRELDFWNPETFEGGVNPFERFDTWQEFLDYYMTPENEIKREYGPGNNIEAGEWYITLVNRSVYLSYVLENAKDVAGGDTRQLPNQRIKYIQVAPGAVRPLRREGKLNPEYFGPYKPNSVNRHLWVGGGKNSWGKAAKLHYRVDFDRGVGISFINWPTENPLEVK